MINSPLFIAQIRLDTRDYFKYKSDTSIRYQYDILRDL